MSNPGRILFDTNVWIDVYDGARRGSSVANRLVDQCESKGVEILYAAVSIKDVYYLLGVGIKRQLRARGAGGDLDDAAFKAVEEYAGACIANMDEVGTAVGMDASDVWLARKYQRIHADFEDDLVLAAAQRAQVDYVVTNDAEMIKHAPVAALTPEDMLALMQ